MSGIPPVCAFLLKIQNEVKLYHWSTKKYARHKSSDKLLKKLQDPVDQFVETCIAIVEDPSLLASSSNSSGTSNNSTSIARASSPVIGSTSSQAAIIATLDPLNAPTINIQTPTDDNYPQLLKLATQVLTTGQVAKAIQRNSALSSIRDTIVEHLHTALYLSRFQ